MPRFKLTLEYAGTRYSGWQIQKNARTVQGEIDARRSRAVTEARQVRALRLGPYRRRRPRARPGRAPRCRHHAAAGDAASAAERRAAGRHQHPARRDVPHRFHARHDATRAATSIRSRVAARPSPNHSSGGSRSRSTSPHARGADVHRDSPTSLSFTDDDPDEKSTKVQIVGRRGHRETATSSLVRIVGSHFLWKMVRRMVGVLVAVGRGELRRR